MTDPARMLVALDAAAHDPGALDILARVARALDAELAALIVQDVDLLRLARLPFARELGAATAIERPLDPEQLRAALCARARRAEQGLSRQAGRARLSLQSTEGKIVRNALAAAEGSDFLLFGAAPQRPRTLARGRTTAGSIVLLLEDAPLPVSTLHVAMRLQRDLGAPLSVLVAAAEQAFARLRDEAAARLGSTTARFRRIAAAGPAVAQATVREHAALIVLPPESRLAEEENLALVLAESCSAVLWVR